MKSKIIKEFSNLKNNWLIHVLIAYGFITVGSLIDENFALKMQVLNFSNIDSWLTMSLAFFALISYVCYFHHSLLRNPLYGKPFLRCVWSLHFFLIIYSFCLIFIFGLEVKVFFNSSLDLNFRRTIAAILLLIFNTDCILKASLLKKAIREDMLRDAKDSYQNTVKP